MIALWFAALALANETDDPLRGASTAIPGEPTVEVPQDLQVLMKQLRDRSLPDRIAAISGALLGRPYAADPLGEGVAPDVDPIARYDVFDCLTYVEEVLSLSLAPDPEQAAWVRNALRYGDQTVTYAHRRHFMELQWIPGVIDDGWMRDTTASYGETVQLEKTVDAKTWAGWAPRSKFHHRDDELPVGGMRLTVLPLAEARRIATLPDPAASFRPGSVLLTVRIDRAGVPLWITHVGLVVRTEQGLMTRHATKIGDGGTRDHGLVWYLDHLRTYGNWAVLGVAVLEPIDRIVSPEPVPAIK